VEFIFSMKGQVNPLRKSRGFIFSYLRYFYLAKMFII